MGLKLPEYLGQIKKTPEELHYGWAEQAKERVEAALLLHAIAEKENIEVTDEEAEKRANEYLGRFKSPADAEKELGSPEDLKERTRGIIRNEKVLALLDQRGKES